MCILYNIVCGRHETQCSGWLNEKLHLHDFESVNHVILTANNIQSQVSNSTSSYLLGICSDQWYPPHIPSWGVTQEKCSSTLFLCVIHCWLILRKNSTPQNMYVRFDCQVRNVHHIDVFLSKTLPTPWSFCVKPLWKWSRGGSQMIDIMNHCVFTKVMKYDCKSDHIFQQINLANATYKWNTQHIMQLTLWMLNIHM